MTNVLGNSGSTPSSPLGYIVEGIGKALLPIESSGGITGGGNVQVDSGKTVIIQNSITLRGKDGGTYTLPDITSSNIGTLNIPQNSQNTAYTAVATDAGKHLYHPASDANARTFTIPANASVAYETGTVITFVNRTSQVLSIAITSDTMTLANTTTTGTRSLAQNGVATAMKVDTTEWLIWGPGLT